MRLYSKSGAALLSASIFAIMSAQVASAQDDSVEQTPEVSSEDTEFLGTIELGSSKREVQTDTPFAVTIIDQAEIDDRQASTIGELIETAPGVDLNGGTTPNGSGLNIRGFGSNTVFGTDQKVAIVIDGANTGSEEIYRLGTQLFTDPNLYKSVEVIRGTAGSFEYGTGIIGGTVRLQTKDASDFTGGEVGFNFGFASGYYDNENGFNISGTGALQATEQLEFLANYTWREQDNQTDGNGDLIPGTEFQLPSFLLKARYTEGAHSLMASFNQTTSADRDVPYETFSGLTGFFGNVDRDTKSQVALATYTYDPFENEFINAELGLTYSNQQIDSTAVGPGSDALRNADHQYEILRFFAKNRPFFETGSFTHDMVIGAELQYRDRLTASSAPGGSDDRFAVYAIDEITVARGLTLTPAVRYETQTLSGTFFNVDTNQLEPTEFDEDALVGALSARYEFENGLSFFGTVARTENLPILDDFVNTVPGGRPPSFNLVNIKEKADTVEVGAAYFKNGIFDERDTFAFKVNYYDTDVDNLTTVSGVIGVEISGIEIESSLGLGNGFYADFNGNIVSGDEDLGNRDDINAVSTGSVTWRQLAQDSFRGTLGYRFNDFLDASVEAVHLAGDDRTRSSRGQISELEVDGATFFNARATLTFDGGALEGTQLRFGLENVFDEVYSPVISLRNGVGRNFKVSVNRTF